MKNLVKLIATEDFINARDLYKASGLSPRSYARWTRKNILCNWRYLEERDFIMSFVVINGKTSIDYVISKNMAIDLMLQIRTNEGHELRKYVIECENTLNMVDEWLDNKIEELK